MGNVNGSPSGKSLSNLFLIKLKTLVIFQKKHFLRTSSLQKEMG